MLQFLESRHLIAVTCNWQIGGLTENFSDPLNWNDSPAGTADQCAAGQGTTLHFDTGTSANNDIAGGCCSGTSNLSINFGISGPFTLNGNAIFSNEPQISLTSTSPEFITLNTPIQLSTQSLKFFGGSFLMMQPATTVSGTPSFEVENTAITFGIQNAIVGAMNFYVTDGASFTTNGYNVQFSDINFIGSGNTASINLSGSSVFNVASHAGWPAGNRLEINGFVNGVNGVFAGSSSTFSADELASITFINPNNWGYNVTGAEYVGATGVIAPGIYTCNWTAGGTTDDFSDTDNWDDSPVGTAAQCAAGLGSTLNFNAGTIANNDIAGGCCTIATNINFGVAGAFTLNGNPLLSSAPDVHLASTSPELITLNTSIQVSHQSLHFSGGGFFINATITVPVSSGLPSFDASDTAIIFGIQNAIQGKMALYLGDGASLTTAGNNIQFSEINFIGGATGTANIYLSGTSVFNVAGINTPWPANHFLNIYGFVNGINGLFASTRLTFSPDELAAITFINPSNWDGNFTGAEYDSATGVIKPLLSPSDLLNFSDPAAPGTSTSCTYSPSNSLFTCTTNPGGLVYVGAQAPINFGALTPGQQQFFLNSITNYVNSLNHA